MIPVPTRAGLLDLEVQVTQMLLTQEENEAYRTPESNESIAHLKSWNRDAVERKEEMERAILHPRRSICNKLEDMRGHYVGGVLSAAWWGPFLQTDTFGVSSWASKNGALAVLAACGGMAVLSLPIILLSIIVFRPVAPADSAMSRTRAASMLTVYMAALCGAIVAVWARKTNLI